MPLMTAIREALRRMGSRSHVLDRCPVCGQPVTETGERVRAWPGKYAHAACASYARRAHRRERRPSQRVYEKFTRT